MRFIGDIHGNLISYLFIRGDAKESIQIGDFGVGFVDWKHITDFVGSNDNKNHRFIRGNHDNLQECLKLPNFIMDNTYEIINDKKVLFIGSAYSIDKKFRTLGIDWWEDEELTAAEWESIIDEYEKEKPDIMVTHDCPQSIGTDLFNPKHRITSVTSNALEILLDIHRPELWVFGHWHQDKDVTMNGTRFVCVKDQGWKDIDL